MTLLKQKLLPVAREMPSPEWSLLKLLVRSRSWLAVGLAILTLCLLLQRGPFRALQTCAGEEWLWSTVGNDPSRATELYLTVKDFAVPTDGLTFANATQHNNRNQLVLPFFKQVPGSGHRALGYGDTSIDFRFRPFVKLSLLRNTLSALRAFAVHHDFTFWLAHGTLLGQQWGQKIMTYDLDVDVKCTLSALHRMAAHDTAIWEGRYTFILNPNYKVRYSRNRWSYHHENNVIDARFIDMATGLYIDITALSLPDFEDDEFMYRIAPPPRHRGSEVETAPANSTDAFPGLSTDPIVQDKSVHRYNMSDIVPLRRCRFEDEEHWCPNNPLALLAEEYPNYQDPWHDGWRFNPGTKMFEAVTCRQLQSIFREPTADNCWDDLCHEIALSERTLGWLLIATTATHGQVVKCRLSLKYGDIGENGQRPSEAVFIGLFDAADQGLLNANLTLPAVDATTFDTPSNFVGCSLAEAQAALLYEEEMRRAKPTSDYAHGLR